MRRTIGIPDSIRVLTERVLGLVPTRYVLAVVAFFGFLNAYCLRFDISVTMVAMVNWTEPTLHHLTDRKSCCNATNGDEDTTEELHGTYDWSPTIQGFLQSSFFYGYVLTQLPGGILAQRFGGKIVFGVGIFVTALLTLLVPWSAEISVYFLMFLRALMGMAQGIAFPGIHQLFGVWAPPLERSKLASFVTTGSYLGSVIVMLLSGYLCRHGFAGGWPSVFYIFGMAGCVWFVFWIFFVYDSPTTHPRIHPVERKYIEESLGLCFSNLTDSQKHSIPWKEIFSSVPVWALNVVSFANTWMFYTLLTLLPTYMKVVLKFNIQQNGLLSSLPYMAMLITANLSGVVADYFLGKSMDITRTRKVVTAIGLIPSIICLLAASWVGCKRYAAVALFTLSAAFLGFVQSGAGVIHLDMSPLFSGALFGIVNTFASLSGIIAPAVAGFITEHDESWRQWAKIFYFTAAINVLGLIVFLLLGCGKVQPWGTGKEYEIIGDSKSSFTELKPIKLKTKSVLAQTSLKRKPLRRSSLECGKHIPTDGK